MQRSRRLWLEGAIVSPAVALLANAGLARAAPTPSCDPGGAPTVPQMEGPFFKPRSPRRTSLLEAGLTGDRLLVTGRVLGRDCRPVPNALLDFWHCDASGEYDNAGFLLRGHQFADAEGRYRLETVVPGEYPGRVRHIHVKVQAPNGPVLTTQLYFPGEPGNAKDFLFRPALLMAVTSGLARREGRFDFVLRTA